MTRHVLLQEVAHCEDESLRHLLVNVIQRTVLCLEPSKREEMPMDDVNAGS